MRPDDDSRRDRAWLAMFVVAHVAFMVPNVWMLVGMVLQPSVDTPLWQKIGNQLVPYPDERWKKLLFLDRYAVAGGLGFLALGIYLAALIARRDRRLPGYYLRYGVPLLLFQATLHAHVWTWAAPPFDAYGIADLPRKAAYAALFAAWIAYVFLSDRARDTFVREPVVADPGQRFSIALVGTALIAWPFLMVPFVEPTTWLAGRLSPKDGTSGSGVAQGLLATPVIIGLFVIMKNALHMKNVWLAVLLPAAFGMLYLAYGLLVFMGHFGR